jgi:FKBP-type peptidyl-prolyl cis-trans isomerase FkpA
MKKIILFAFMALLLTSACKKKKTCDENTVQAPETEITSLRNYLSANSITTKEDPRGFFYIITDSVFGSKPTTCDNIRIAYKGTLLNGSVFDQSNSATFTLSNLIAGWQQALPLIGIGGSIKLYLPPTLGYGDKASGSIPANSNLVFEIDLLGF